MFSFRARKRMTGEDVYGTKIKIEIEEQNTPKFHPIPRQSFPRSPQPRPSYPPVRPPLMRPHYLGGRGPPVPQYLPQHPTGGFPPPPQHHPFSQPRHPGRFPPAPPRPLPVNNYQVRYKLYTLVAYRVLNRWEGFESLIESLIEALKNANCKV